MSIKIEKNIPIPVTDWESMVSYRQQSIIALSKLKKGESIVVKDRTRETAIVWTRWATSALGVSVKYTKDMYVVKSIDKKTQRVWRIK